FESETARGPLESADSTTAFSALRKGAETALGAARRGGLAKMASMRMSKACGGKRGFWKARYLEFDQKNLKISKKLSRKKQKVLDPTQYAGAASPRAQVSRQPGDSRPPGGRPR